MKHFISLFVLFCTIFCTLSYAEELPDNFNSLPWTEKTASKWVDQIPPIYEEVYLSEAPTDKAYKIYGIEEKLNDKDEIVYKVFIDVSEKQEVINDFDYIESVSLKVEELAPVDEQILGEVIEVP